MNLKPEIGRARRKYCLRGAAQPLNTRWRNGHGLANFFCQRLAVGIIKFFKPFGIRAAVVGGQVNGQWLFDFLGVFIASDLQGAQKCQHDQANFYAIWCDVHQRIVTREVWLLRA